MSLRTVLRTFVAMLGLGAMVAPMQAATWFPLGPFGGNTRTIVADPRNPRHLYMGTATGWVFESEDAGVTWTRLALLGRHEDLVIDHILTDPKDPKRLIVGAWIVDHPDGGLFISEDGGHSWYDQAEMHGQSVRSMTRSLSNPNVLVAGTLEGVYRSDDNGTHWHRISPLGSAEIHEIESVAIDPVNPNVIYAGTWHLPWKTTDGGKTWQSMKKGLIEDSDVFSIIVDPLRANIVYLSACSGIYKSTDSGADFIGGVGVYKLQGRGIPVDARRTRKLLQDPKHPETVYGGTTQGLYRTQDGGASWQRLTGPDVIVNDVMIDPTDSNHLYLATDYQGILVSKDDGASFQPSNAGFAARQVDAYAADPRNPATLYVGVVSDKDSGGVFLSTDGGVRWEQMSGGLEGSDVFSLDTTREGTLLAGTGHGIFRLQDGLWMDSSVLMPPPAPPAPVKPVVRRPGAHAVPAKKPDIPQVQKLDAVVYSMANSTKGIYAGTSNGVDLSVDNGRSWSAVTTLQMPETHYIAVQGKTVLAAGLKRMALSVDEGNSWDAVPLPAELTQINCIAVDSLNNLWVGGREGVWYSTDYGLNWKAPKDMVMNEVSSIFYDAEKNRVLVTSSNSQYVFSATLPEYKIHYWDSGWQLRFARPVGDYLIGATLFDGMVVQPKMVVTPTTDLSSTAMK